jgi:hypothetical protein
VVDARVETPDIALEEVPPAATEPLTLPHGRVYALPWSAGVGVFDGGPLQHRPDRGTDGVVHHPVPERRRRDLPLLGVVDDKPSGRTGPPGAGRQLRLQGKNLRLDVPEKTRDLGAPLLSAGSPTGGGQDRCE